MDLNGYWWYWPPVFFVVLPCTYSHCYGMVCIMLVVGSHSGSVRIHIPLDSLIFRSWRPQTSSTWVLLYVYHPWPAPFLSLITLTYRKTDECRWSWHKMENKILALSMNGKVLWLSGCRMVDENDEPLVVISLSSTGVRVSTSPLVGSLITSSWLPSLLNLLCSYFALSLSVTCSLVFDVKNTNTCFIIIITPLATSYTLSGLMTSRAWTYSSWSTNNDTTLSLPEKLYENSMIGGDSDRYECICMNIYVGEENKDNNSNNIKNMSQTCPIHVLQMFCKCFLILCWRDELRMEGVCCEWYFKTYS